ncbi:MAG TPA: fluoride efflux transporter CrcB [Alphaproteobacteria bacterium]|nr:fluoride efflux transporter CrcB [Alphaproteobacteria bacterium]
MWNTILLVFLGGGAGSVARWGMTNFVSKQVTPGSTFPWHTLSVNIIGAFIIGILMEILALRLSAPQPARFLLVTGFLGGFTTFSAFSLEAAMLMERGDYAQMAAYVAVSVIGCIGCVFLGSFLVKMVS